MRVRWVLIAVVAVASLLSAPVAYAQGCAAGAVRQDDMAGVYVSPESLMRLEVYPCGGTYLQWDNAYGRHSAVYVSVGRLPGGGYAADGVPSDPANPFFLDAATRLGYKPAEPGYIQVVTIGDYQEQIRVYRLRKVR